MALRLGRRRAGRARRNFNPKEVFESKVLFDMLVKASGKSHWKDQFEVRIKLGDERYDQPIPKDAARPLIHKLLVAINFFHAGAIRYDPERMTIMPYRGEPAAYAMFNGFTLVVGSTGYAG